MLLLDADAIAFCAKAARVRGTVYRAATLRLAGRAAALGIIPLPFCVRQVGLVVKTYSWTARGKN